MTYLRHRCTVAFAILLLTVICLQSSGALLVQGPDANNGRNIPTCHCCHAKVFLKFDRRFDLKPVFLLPSRIVTPGDLVTTPTHPTFLFFCTLAARTTTSTTLRGPPDPDVHPDRC